MFCRLEPISIVEHVPAMDMDQKSVNTLVADLIASRAPTIELRGHSYEDHRKVVPMLLSTVKACGCWVTEQHALSSTSTELFLEVPLRSVFELYSEILSSGIELTRDSHTCMTALCTVRDHNPRAANRRRIITVRLALNFLEGGGREIGKPSRDA
jgi:hypothetical protein